MPSGTAVLPLQTRTKSNQKIPAAGTGLLHLTDGAGMRRRLRACAHFSLSPSKTQPDKSHETASRPSWPRFSQNKTAA